MVQLQALQMDDQQLTIAVYDVSAVMRNREAVVAAHSAMSPQDRGWTLAGIVYSQSGQACYAANEMVEWYLSQEQNALTLKCSSAMQNYMTVNQVMLENLHSRGQPALRVMTGWKLILANFEQNKVPQMLLETWLRMQKRMATSITEDDMRAVIDHTLGMIHELLTNLQAPSSLPPKLASNPNLGRHFQMWFCKSCSSRSQRTGTKLWLHNGEQPACHSSMTTSSGTTRRAA